MKKRKNPVILVTALVLLGSAVAFMNMPQSASAGGDGHNHDQPKSEEKVEAPSKESVASSVASKVSGGKPSTRPVGAPEEMRGPGGPGGPSGPSILKPKMEPYKPTPNDSSTSTQWYTEETPKELPKKK